MYRLLNMDTIRYVRLECWEEKRIERIGSGSFSDAFSLEEIGNINFYNCILGTITHSFENISLPLSLNALFADKEDAQCVVCNTNITSVMENNCECEEISMVQFKIQNLTTTATYRLVGCEFEDLDSEVLRLKEILTDSIPKFCEIDHFNMVFVNKGKKTIRSFTNCEDNND